jgi:hypothetical protein
MSAATGQGSAVTTRGPRRPAGPRRRRLVGSLLLNGASRCWSTRHCARGWGSEATALAIGATVTAALLL